MDRPLWRERIATAPSTKPHSHECGWDLPNLQATTVEDLQRSRTPTSADGMAVYPNGVIIPPSTKPHSHECGWGRQILRQPHRPAVPSTKPHSHECGWWIYA